MSDTATVAPTPAAVPERPALWTVMPGWGIAADLIPPELVAARQVKVLRKWIAAGIAVLILLCAGGYYLAARESDQADADLAAVEDQTSQLQAIGRGYSDVVAIQNRVDQVETQVATLMAGDVDLVALINQLQNNLPATMVIGQQSITISSSGVAGAGDVAGGALDTSGEARIGTVTMSGTGQTLDDLSDYIDRLQEVPGLVDVVPLANSVTGDGVTGTQFSITLGLTDVLLSHRFDIGG